MKVTVKALKAGEMEGERTMQVNNELTMPKQWTDYAVAFL